MNTPAQVTEAHIDLSRAVNRSSTIMGGAQLIADGEARATRYVWEQLALTNTCLSSALASEAKLIAERAR